MRDTKNILVIAPHPDDEVLGCGGAIARFSQENQNVYVAILTKAGPSLFSPKQVSQGRAHALKAHQLLGVKETFFFDLPAAGVDSVPHAEINQIMNELFAKTNPHIVFTPFSSDLHLDHQCIFLSTLVAARPNKSVYPEKMYAYETLSETNWNAPYLTSAFHPNVYVDISNYLDTKLQAFNIYQDQLKSFPHERSLEAISALAMLRGSTVHRKAAEAFVLIRGII